MWAYDTGEGAAPDGVLESIGFSADSTSLVLASRTTPVVSVRTGRVRMRAGIQASEVALSPDGRTVALAQRTCDGAGGLEPTRLVLYDLRTRTTTSWLAHEDAVNCLQFSPDGALLASGGNDGKLKLWRVR